jgi:hypothetical protein
VVALGVLAVLIAVRMEPSDSPMRVSAIPLLLKVNPVGLLGLLG